MVITEGSDPYYGGELINGRPLSMFPCLEDNLSGDIKGKEVE